MLIPKTPKPDDIETVVNYEDQEKPDEDEEKAEYERVEREESEQTKDYDYMEIPKEWADTGVEVREHQCEKKFLFVSAARRLNNMANGTMRHQPKSLPTEYDWNQVNNTNEEHGGISG